MTDTLRDRLREALDADPHLTLDEVLDTVVPIAEQALAEARRCGCPEADAEHARVLARAEQNAAALARVAAVLDEAEAAANHPVRTRMFDGTPWPVNVDITRIRAALTQQEPT